MKKILIIVFSLVLWPAVMTAQDKDPVPWADWTLTTESNLGDQVVVVQGDTAVRMTLQTLLELAFPDQTSHVGDILYSDGTDPYWADPPAGGGGGGVDTSYIATDTINERDPDHGVLVEEVLNKDGNLALKSGNRLYLDGGTNNYLRYSAGTLDIYVDGVVPLAMTDDNITVYKTILPVASGEKDIGADYYWWGSAYVTDHYIGNTSTGIYKDPSGNLTFFDAVAGTKTLAEIAAGGGADISDTVVVPTIFAWAFTDSAQMEAGRDFIPVEWGGSPDSCGIDSLRVLCITDDTPNFSFQAYANDTLNSTSTTAEGIFTTWQSVGAASTVKGQTFVPDNKLYLAPEEKMWIRFNDRTLLPRYGATIQAYCTVY